MATEAGDYYGDVEVHHREALLHRSISAPSLSVKPAAVLRLLGIRKPPLPAELQVFGKAAGSLADAWSMSGMPIPVHDVRAAASATRRQHCSGREVQRDVSHLDSVPADAPASSASSAGNAFRNVRTCRSTGRLTAVAWAPALALDQDDMDCSPSCEAMTEAMTGVERPQLAGALTAAELPGLVTQAGPGQAPPCAQMPQDEDLQSYGAATTRHAGCGVRLSGDFVGPAAAAAQTAGGRIPGGRGRGGAAAAPGLPPGPRGRRLHDPAAAAAPSAPSSCGCAAAVNSASTALSAAQRPPGPAAPVLPTEPCPALPPPPPPLEESDAMSSTSAAAAAGAARLPRAKPDPAPRTAHRPPPVAAHCDASSRRQPGLAAAVRRFARPSSSDSDWESDSDPEDRWGRRLRRAARASASGVVVAASEGYSPSRSPLREAPLREAPLRETPLHLLVVAEGLSSISLTLGPGVTRGSSRSAGGSPTRSRQPRQRSVGLTRKRLLV